MLSDVAFGQYYPASSPIHRLDPRTKIVVLIAYIVMIFLIKNFVGFLLAGGFLLATIIIAKVPIGAVIKSVKAILFIIIAFPFFEITLFGLSPPLFFLKIAGLCKNQSLNSMEEIPKAFFSFSRDFFSIRET